MDKTLFGIENFDAYAVLGILILFSFLETYAGHFHQTKRSFGDWIQEFGGFIVLSVLVKPLIVLFVIFMGGLLLPNLYNTLSSTSLWITLPFYLLIDDFLQYWYHRLAHEYTFLWKLHRAHHQAEEMGFFVSYRNALLYYWMMPNIYWLSFFIFLGGAKAVIIGLVLKQLVIVSSHSTMQWDKYFYKNKMLLPFILLIERILITPAFHFSHHGKTKADGISDPNGNFGNMFSIWDQFFGTATFTRDFPKELGLVNDPKDSWAASYFYPLVTSDKPESELAKGFQKKKNTTAKPTLIELEEGKKYLWCQCGFSKNQPFCDGSHHGTKHKPILFEAKKTGTVKLCNCKLTMKAPFCDGSHVKMNMDN